VNLAVAVTPEPAADVLVVRLTGWLTLHTAPVVRAALLKCLAQSPAAVLVDVSEMRAQDRSRLAIFPAAVHAHGQPDAVLMLYGAGPELGDLLTGGILGDVRWFRTSQDARTAMADAGRARRARKLLAATPDAPRAARTMVAEVCQSWQIGHLSGPASLIISELVTNAVRHAGTDVDVGALLRGDYLHLTVHDESPQAAVVPGMDVAGAGVQHTGGRGLYLVDVLTTAWGVRYADDGKTVWATLRARPMTG